MSVTDHLRRISKPMKLQEGKMGYLLFWLSGRSDTDPYHHLPPARLRLKRR